MNAAILTDLTRCIGCGACAIICKQVNELPGKIGGKLDAYTWTIVESRKGHYIRRQCMHCLEPTCASVCPVAALHKTEYGAVTYDSGKCIGCRYCIMACPFDVPKYQWDSPVPIVGKCIMCVNKRLAHGKQPACTETCPASATVFGDRNTLLEEARRRIKEHPERYVNHIYGEKEASGTSVLYLSPVSFRELGFKSDLIREAYPELTWKIIDKVPDVLGIGGISLFGIMWVINRRIEMKRRLVEEVDDEKE
ncbi:MAG: 4Fe-4S dicluster domain-containing protein [Armatimonadetes bacterium]|nr:4Fe-4S dicluster domain-containing protein [Armatimonadota bacterium]